MNVQLLIVASVAFGCAAAAVVLWQAAALRAHRTATMRRLGGKLAPAIGPAPAERPRQHAAGVPASAWSRRLDLSPGPATALLVGAPAPLLAAAVAAAAGWAMGGIALVLFALVTVAALAMRREGVQRRLVRAVPGFIDAMVRTIVLGQSPAAAFQVAVQSTEGSLRHALDHAQAMVAAGLDLDAALAQAGRACGSEPLVLLGSVMHMSMQYGGRVDQVLERVAAFLRDREEAEQELVAVSAETRMSAWVLGLLPIAVTLMIMFANSAYLAGMWNDAGGRQLLVGALVLEAAGAYLLYRLARLR